MEITLTITFFNFIAKTFATSLCRTHQAYMYGFFQVLYTSFLKSLAYRTPQRNALFHILQSQQYWKESISNPFNPKALFTLKSHIVENTCFESDAFKPLASSPLKDSKGILLMLGLQFPQFEKKLQKDEAPKSHQPRSVKYHLL